MPKPNFFLWSFCSLCSGVEDFFFNLELNCGELLESSEVGRLRSGRNPTRAPALCWRPAAGSHHSLTWLTLQGTSGYSSRSTWQKARALAAPTVRKPVPGISSFSPAPPEAQSSQTMKANTCSHFSPQVCLIWHTGQVLKLWLHH